VALAARRSSFFCTRCTDRSLLLGFGPDHYNRSISRLWTIVFWYLALLHLYAGCSCVFFFFSFLECIFLPWVFVCRLLLFFFFLLSCLSCVISGVCAFFGCHLALTILIFCLFALQSRLASPFMFVQAFKTLARAFLSLHSAS